MRPSWRHPPALVAHRGASDVAPENTLAAFRQAIIQGARAIEFDVRLTLDDVLVIHHDASLGRTVSGEGLIEELPSAAVAGQDAGTWFNARFAGECVPTLDEVLTEMPADVLLNIELKADASNATRLPQLVHDLVEQHGAMERVLVTSFDGGLASEFAALARRPAGLIMAYEPEQDDITEWPLLTTFAVAEDALDEKVVRRLKDAGRHVLAWTVNDPARASELRACGVDSVITDRWRSLAQTIPQDASVK